MRTRPIVLSLAAAAALIASVAWLRRDHRISAEPPPGPPLPLESESPGRPPEFPAVTSEDARIVHWVHVLQTGGEDDVAWALSRLRLAGAQGRRAVRDAAQVSVEGNPALSEQALEFLLAGPAPEDLAFAFEALASSDPQTVARAAKLVTAVEVPPAERPRFARRLAEAAAGAGRTVRALALSALARIGGPEAREEAVRVLGLTPPDQLAAAYDALSASRDPQIHDALARAFATSQDVLLRLAAADALVSCGDRSPVDWLRMQLDAAPRGPYDIADTALGSLAKAKDEDALRRVGAVAANPLEGAKARLSAIQRLVSYPLAAKKEFLEAAVASPGGEDDVRVEALSALATAGSADTLRWLQEAVRSGDRASAYASALVLGRLRRPDLSACLLAGLARSDADDELRAILVRALVLSGDTQAAQAIVQAMAQDRTVPGAPVSVSYNVVAILADATPAMRTALGAALLRSLEGANGKLEAAGLANSIRATVLCCGEEAGATLAPYLLHPDEAIRYAAVVSLGWTGGPDAERDLKAAWWRTQDPHARSSLAQAIERAHFRFVAAAR